MIEYHSFVIRRFYVHNFRCLENFELNLAGRASTLLIGNNGSGKSTVAAALEVLQKIGSGTNRVKELVSINDLTRGRSDLPVRFEIDLDIGNHLFGYTIAFELPDGFKELRVLDEKLFFDGRPIYTREVAKVHLASAGGDGQADFKIDWHLVALAIIQQRLPGDPLSVFKQWLGQMLILRPIPSLISGESTEETLVPDPYVRHFGAWFSGLIAHAPSAYGTVAQYLQQVIPDLKDITNPKTGPDSRNLVVQFATDQGSFHVPFASLSDGEKCYMICALVLATKAANDPMFCFWDEPDNYLALNEVGHFVMELRKAFQSGGQFVATSHNPEAISRFSRENTLYLSRRNHLEPSVVRPLTELPVNGDLISALIRGDVEP